jgi:hypothetical protein
VGGEGGRKVHTLVSWKLHGRRQESRLGRQDVKKWTSNKIFQTFGKQ